MSKDRISLDLLLYFDVTLPILTNSLKKYGNSVSSLSDNELMVHKQPPCAKIGGKSVQNRGQSVILSGENHHLPYTIIGGGSHTYNMH